MRKNPEYAQDSDNSGRSEWDSRELFVQYLQQLDVLANSLKSRIEGRESIADMVDSTRAYMSALRQMFRSLSPFYKEKDRCDAMIKIRRLQGLIEKAAKNVCEYDIKLENDLEDLHLELNAKRFKAGLITPMAPDPDITGIAGWESKE